MDEYSAAKILGHVAASLAPDDLDQAVKELGTRLAMSIHDLQLKADRLEDERDNLQSDLHYHKVEVAELREDLEHARRQLQINVDFNKENQNTAITILSRLIGGGLIPDDHGIILEELKNLHHQNQNKIRTIKFIRQITRLGLKQCKDMFDFWV
jgi:chromosome segregation ATPase